MSQQLFEFTRDFWVHVDRQREIDKVQYEYFESEIVDKRELIKQIEDRIVMLVNQLANRETPYFEIRSRRNDSNINYQPNVGLVCQENPHMTVVSLGNKNSMEKFGLLLKVMSMIYKHLQLNKVTTKRDLYYEEPHLFKNQRVLDGLVDDVACMLRVPRRCLNVVATSKGCLQGDLQYREMGSREITDCSLSAAGILVPTLVDEITNVSTRNAKFVLVIEKDATFQHLLDGKFTQKFPCILVTGKGVPDVNVRLMIRKIRNNLHLPVFGLMDADPYGIEIMFVYKFGSKSQVWDSNNLNLPFMHWIGVFPSDIRRLQLPEDAVMPLTKNDEKKLLDMYERPYVEGAIKEQIEEMLTTRTKAEIQAVNKISPSYLGDTFLPRKIKHGKWI